jgi:predicted nucleotidyltransferase component of viral defense system
MAGRFFDGRDILIGQGGSMAYEFHSDEHEAIRMLQTRVVANLFTSSVKEQFALKGGLAFQAVMGSERATADLDLDASKEMPVARLREAMRRSIADSLTGLLEGVHVTEPKQTDTVCRWKIWGMLPGTASEVHFKVEVSRRDELATPSDAAWFDWKSEGKAVDGVRAKAHRPEVLCFMKLKALLSSMRDAPRDLHDLNVLIEAGYKPESKMMAKLTDAELVNLADDAWDKVEMMSYPRFMSEVAPYLPPAVATRIDEGVYEEMRIRVGSCAESWAHEEVGRRLGAPEGSWSGASKEDLLARLSSRRCAQASLGSLPEPKSPS